MSLTSDGCISWGDFHESLMGVKAAKPYAVPDEDKTFTSGEPPAKQMGPQGEDEIQAAYEDRGDV